MGLDRACMILKNRARYFISLGRSNSRSRCEGSLLSSAMYRLAFLGCVVALSSCSAAASIEAPVTSSVSRASVAGAAAKVLEIMPSEIEQKFKDVKDFKPEGGILRYPALTNFHFFLPYAASHPYGPAKTIQLNVSNYNDEGWPAPSGVTVDWYVEQALPGAPTFYDAQLAGIASSRNFKDSQEYSLYVYDTNNLDQWVYVETIPLGRPTNHRLDVPSPFENGFAPTSIVVFEIVH